MEERATLSGGIALNSKELCLIAICASICTLYPESGGGAGGGEDKNNPVSKD